MVESTDPEWMNGTFDTLNRLFNRVVLKTNIGKTAGMIFCPYLAEETQPETSYERRMTGEGLAYQ